MDGYNLGNIPGSSRNPRCSGPGLGWRLGRRWPWWLMDSLACILLCDLFYLVVRAWCLVVSGWVVAVESEVVMAGSGGAVTILYHHILWYTTGREQCSLLLWPDLSLSLSLSLCLLSPILDSFTFFYPSTPILIPSSLLPLRHRCFFFFCSFHCLAVSFSSFLFSLLQIQLFQYPPSLSLSLPFGCYQQ